ncbi:MAG: hypothetical protein HC819_17900 [Cyclobacteriaceae bacterium]|nr:hypothetical protein [Cyclobacteriaceae bacterium]
MIRISIITAVSLILLYNLYLILIFDDKIEIYAQNISQDNLIKVQEYLFAEKQPEIVIVGSSLAAKLDMNQLKGFFNLAFRGRSIYDGFNIIMDRKGKPNIVLVEYNAILKPPSLSIFNDDIFGKIDRVIKSNIPSQRAKYQPVNLVISMAYMYISESKRHNDNHSIESDSDKSSLIEEDKIRVNENALVMEEEIPDDSVFKSSFTLLKDYVEHLKKQDIQIIFFEMPVNEAICDSEAHRKIRSMVKENFPSDEFFYIKPDECSKYTTKDRIHLTEESAIRFTRYLKAQIPAF